MAIDKKLIFRKINLIIRDLQKLKPISLLSWPEYHKKFDYEALTERYLERIIGRMIDINFHIIIGGGHPSPEDYFSSFRMLGELGIVPHDAAERLAPLAGLRNRLAHEYDRIDERKIYNKLRDILRDSPVYLGAIEKFSDRNNLQKAIQFKSGKR